MADRNLVTYLEENDGKLTGYKIEIDRSAAGQPGIIITVTNALDEPSTIIIKDGLALFGPVLEWLLTDDLIIEVAREAALFAGPAKWALEGLCRVARSRLEADATEDGSPVQS